jgi:hypothetical protein
VKRFKVDEKSILLAQVIAQVIDAYNRDGTSEKEVVARMQAELEPGQEVVLKNTGWQQMPLNGRYALIEIIQELEELAATWRMRYQIDFIRPTVETTRHLVKVLKQGGSATIADIEPVDNGMATIRAAGQKDKRVLFASALLSLTAMGLNVGTQPEEITLFV